MQSMCSIILVLCCVRNGLPKVVVEIQITAATYRLTDPQETKAEWLSSRRQLVTQIRRANSLLQQKGLTCIYIQRWYADVILSSCGFYLNAYSFQLLATLPVQKYYLKVADFSDGNRRKPIFRDTSLNVDIREQHIQSVYYSALLRLSLFLLLSMDISSYRITYINTITRIRRLRASAASPHSFRMFFRRRLYLVDLHLVINEIWFNLCAWSTVCDDHAMFAFNVKTIEIQKGAETLKWINGWNMAVREYRNGLSPCLVLVCCLMHHCEVYLHSEFMRVSAIPRTLFYTRKFHYLV